jgi:hypothetical protein
MSRLSVICWEPTQAHRELANVVWPRVKAETMAGQRVIVEVKRETRSLAENRKLHALLGQIADQIEWGGKLRDIETWKRLLTAAWLRARGEDVEVLPAIDGSGVDVVFRRTADLTRQECAELIDFVEAWCADQGVEDEQQIDG